MAKRNKSLMYDLPMAPADISPACLAESSQRIIQNAHRSLRVVMTTFRAVRLALDYFASVEVAKRQEICARPMAQLPFRATR